METQAHMSGAREAIFDSIRSHLASSAELDAREEAAMHEAATTRPIPVQPAHSDTSSLIDLFTDSLEAVDGHCVVVQNESELKQALTDIVRDLRQTKLCSLRVAM